MTPMLKMYVCYDGQNTSSETEAKLHEATESNDHKERVLLPNLYTFIAL